MILPAINLTNDDESVSRFLS